MVPGDPAGEHPAQQPTGLALIGRPRSAWRFFPYGEPQGAALAIIGGDHSSRLPAAFVNQVSQLAGAHSASHLLDRPFRVRSSRLAIQPIYAGFA